MQMAISLPRIPFRPRFDSAIKEDQKFLEQAALVALLLFGLIARLMILSSDLEHLIQFVPDDAFYYFQTARNIASGHGSTFDGLHLANGFHPLWMFLILPLAANSLDSLSFLKAALGIGISFNLLTSLLLNVLLFKTTERRWVSLAGTALYFLNPQTVLSSLNGLETSVSSLAFVSCLTIIVAKHPSQDHKSAVMEGISLGLLFLARTDNVFYVAALLFTAIYPRRFRLYNGLVLVLILALLTCPWLLWNWFTFGSFIQSSADAFPFVLHQNFLQAGHTASDLIGQSAIFFLGFMLFSLPLDLGFVPIIYQATILYCFLVFVKQSPGIAGKKTTQSAILRVCLLWAGGVLLIFVHTFVRWYPREWYFDPLIVLSALTFCLAFALIDSESKWFSAAHSPLGKQFSRNFGRTRVGIGLFLIGSITLIALLWSRLSYEAPYAHQIEMLDAANWLEANLRQDEAASAFNAGIMGFFSHRRVVNLDGTINDSARTAIMQGTLWRLMRNSGICYYADYDPVMLRMYSAYLGQNEGPVRMIPLQDIDRPGVSWSGAAIKIYRLDCSLE